MDIVTSLFDALAEITFGGWLMLAFYLISGYLGKLGITSLIDRWYPMPTPKPRTYRVTVEDTEGWPLRSYDVPIEVSGTIIQTLERAPKPRTFRVTVEDKDNWPLRSYDVPIEVASPILRDLERTKQK